MKLRTTVALAALGLTLTACGTGGGGAGGDSIKVAVLDAASGKLSSFGIETQRGAELAFEEINAAGGVTIGGKKVTFDYEFIDLQSDPAAAAQSAQKAVSGGSNILVGATASALAEPIAGVARRAGGKVLLIGAATVLDRYVGGSDPIFRTLTPDDLSARQYVPVLREQFPEVKTIGALMINDAVGQSILKLYPPEFEKNGFKVASSDTFPATETNFVPLLQRAADDAQGFFIGYSDPVNTGIVRAALETGKAKVFFNRGALCQPGIDAGPKIDGYTCIIYTEDALNPSSDKAKAYFAKYKEKYGKVDSNSSQSLYYYDYIHLLKQAIEKAGTGTDVQKIADALRGSSYDGVIKVSFDAKGVNTTGIKVGVVKKGQISVVPGANAG